MAQFYGFERETRVRRNVIKKKRASSASEDRYMFLAADTGMRVRESYK